MLPRRIPPPRRGDYPARSRNAPLAMLEQLARVRGGRGTLWSPAGPLVAAPGLPVRIGITQDNGIDAAEDDGTYHGSDVLDASMVIDDRDGYTAHLQAWESTFVGFNLSSQAVAGNATTLYYYMFGLWICFWEDCQPAGS